MKKPLKERLINVLKTDVSKWNRYLRFSLNIDIDFYADLSSANLRSANLSYADLRYANLSSANLSSANLRSANLSYADLSYADLSYADLRSANLRSANLRSANLSYANLDMSCLSLSCKSLKFKSDLRIRTQFGFHFASLIANAEQKNVTDEEKEIFAKMLDYVNRFHRTDVAKLENLK